jgi:hypothetical protein
MKTPLIPWRVFFTRLHKKKSKRSHEWFYRWLFTDDGVALMRRRGNNTTDPVSRQAHQKRAVLERMRRTRWPKTLH